MDTKDQLIFNLKREIRMLWTLLIVLGVVSFFAIGNLWTTASKKHQALIDIQEQKNDTLVGNKYTIILNDDWEAMPGENGLLRVDFFKGDTAYVLPVEE